MDTTVLENKDMKQFTIQVPECQSSFFMELMHRLNLQVEDEDEKCEEYSEEDILENIKRGIREIKLINQGKLTAHPVSEIMKELYDL